MSERAEAAFPANRIAPIGMKPNAGSNPWISFLPDREALCPERLRVPLNPEA